MDKPNGFKKILVLLICLAVPLAANVRVQDVNNGQGQNQTQESLTASRLKEKLMKLISDKIAKKVSEKDIKLEFKLAMDLSGNFTVKTNFNNLHQSIQNEAKEKGYKNGDTVQIIVDSPSLDYRMVTSTPKLEWSSKVLEIIPAKEENGVPSFKFLSDFNVLPKKLQKQAKTKWYKKGDLVKYIFHDATDTFEILPKRLLVGLPCKWGELNNKEQKKAIKLGYRASDIIWKSSDSKGKYRFPKNLLIKAQKIDGKVSLTVLPKGLFTLIPANRISIKPLMRISHILIDGATHKITFRCLCKFRDLSNSDRVIVLKMGYKEGDEILYYYDTKKDRFLLQEPPGIPQKSVQIKTAQKKTIILGKKLPVLTFKGHKITVYLHRIIPGVKNTFLCNAYFDKLPEELQKDARELGYKSGGIVRFALGETKGSSKMLPAKK